jgi:hypothetical protein
MEKFAYSESIRIGYWGCRFDSLLELKFALSIKDEYDFIRSPVHIYYDPRTKIPTNYLRYYIRRYTPDFLIRHKTTGIALLIEIKPGAFRDERQLQIRREVSENYIRWKKYDWKFKGVYDHDILLSQKLQEQFSRCCKLLRHPKGKVDPQKIDERFDRSSQECSCHPIIKSCISLGLETANEHYCEMKHRAH